MSLPGPGHGPGMISRLDRADAAWIAVLCLILVVGIAFADYWSGFEVDFTVFYTLPIVLATWRLGHRGGLVATLLCELGESLAETLGGQHYTDPWAHFWNPVLRLAYFVVILVIIHRLKGAYTREQTYSREDMLTGLPNSRAFMETADHELRRVRRLGGPISLLYLDCDDFKSVNDRYGHSAGDTLLCFVGGMLRLQVRETDTPARIGGDEFAVILPGADEAAVLEIANRLKEALEAPALQGERDVKVSMGAVTFLEPPVSVDAMIQAGDVLMYEAKAAGKAGIRTAVFPA